MRFLIAGFGSIGRRHFRNLAALGEKDIHFLRTHKSNIPDEEITAYPVHTDLLTALSHNPDAVIISNPSSMHLDIALPAAEQGCHLLVEKPLSYNLDRVEKLTSVVTRSGSRILMGYQFRYHPGLIHVHDLISSGAIGRILSTRASWGEYLPAWHPWEDYRNSYSARSELGGGVILTLCHPFDYLRWLIGEVDAVWAFSGTLGDLDLDVEDTAEIGMRFRNGAYGSLHLSYNQRPTSHYLEVIGTRGTIRWDNGSGGVEVYQVSKSECQKIPLGEGFERNDLFLELMRHFLAIVNGLEQPICTLEDGMKALELVLAAKKSSDLGQLISLN